MILIPKYKDTLQLSGALSIILTDTTIDKIKQEVYVPNLVVTSGKQWIASRMIGVAVPVMGYMGLGTGTTNSGTDALALAMTGLGAVTSGVGASELTGNGYTRTVVTQSQTSNTADIVYAATFGAQNPNIASTGALLREAGIFTTITAGTMLCRTVFPLVTKMPNDSLTITWTITIN